MISSVDAIGSYGSVKEMITVHSVTSLALRGDPSRVHSWFPGYGIFFSWFSKIHVDWLSSFFLLQIYMDDCTVCCLRVQHRLAIQSWQEEPASKIFLGDTHLENYWWYAVRTGLIRSSIYDFRDSELQQTICFFPLFIARCNLTAFTFYKYEGKSFQQKKVGSQKGRVVKKPC